MYIPEKTIHPKKTSYQTTFFRLMRGSKIDTKKAPEDKQAKVTEILATFIALKKVNQCKAIINPASKKHKNNLKGTLSVIFFTSKYNKTKIKANNILNQTKGKASKEINAPKIAVKPQIKTIK